MCIRDRDLAPDLGERDGVRQSFENWTDGNGNGVWDSPEKFQDTNGDGKHSTEMKSELDMFMLDLENKDEDDRGACQLLDVPHKDINVTFVDFSAGQDSTLMLLAATFLFVGIGNWLVGSTRINDINEAKYMTMIISGLVLQYLIFA